MGKDPSMPFYVNDWLSSSKVCCMSLEQQGAFVRLLCHCWASQDASIPDDENALAALSGMGEGWLKGGSTMVLRCFQPHPHLSGCLTNQKVYDLWEERQQWREKSRQGGLKSAAKRRSSKDLGESKGGSTTLATKVQPKGNSSSSSSSSLIPSGRLAVRTVDFQNEWEDLKPKVQELATAIGGKRRLKPDDRELAIKAAVFADLLNGEVGKIAGGIETKRRRDNPPDNPWAYFKSSLIRVSKEAGIDFDAQWKAIEIPEALIRPPKPEAETR